MRAAARGNVDGRWGVVAFALVALSTLLGLLASQAERFPVDRAVTEWFNDFGRWYEPLAGLTNEFGAYLAVGSVLLGSAIAWRRGRLDLALLLPLALIAHWPLTSAKAAVDRPRPEELLVVRDAVSDSSFPSGHVMTTVTAAGLWFVLAPQLLPARWVLPTRALAVALIALSGLGRMWAGVHWLSDVYGGVIWASALVAATLALRPLLTRLLARMD